MRASAAPGLALAVTERDRLVHVAAYGYADVAAQKPVTPDTLFEIGSIGKSFTAIALLQLHEAGRLDLHAPVTHYLPWFHVPSSFEPITVHHLLSHTAGIIMGSEFSGEARYAVWALRHTQAAAPPGTFFHYSNVGYKALGLALEALTGQSYGEIIQERVLAPLEMAASVPAITHDTRRRMAVGYEPLYDDRPAHSACPLAPATWLETATADGSIAATAADLAAYLRMLLNRGQGPRGRLLSEESFRRLTRPVIAPDDGAHGEFYAYGLTVGQREGHMCIGHSGGMVGYYSAMLGDVDAGLGVVVLVNGPGEPMQLAESLLLLLRTSRLPAPPDPTRVENAAAYTGTYRGSGKSFTLMAESERLVMRYKDEHVTLEPRDADCFYAPHPDFALFLLRFEREGEQVIGATHGPDWLPNQRYAGPTTFDFPPAWSAYTGHFRSHNPWYPNFRVVLRKGALWLVEPGGDEHLLAPLGDGLFRVGVDERLPEQLRFDTVVDGQALRANLSLCDYFRTFTV